MDKPVIRVRFAPSPTGFLHIGGARTALFNWLYARNQGGKFILRIEDTDKVRSKQEYLDEILDSMQWLGLNWDEYYKQSDRFDLYRQYADKLLSEGKAYKDGEAVILKMPENQSIKLFDIIRDEIKFDSAELKDQVLMKSDGSPTYGFANVIDDALMEITHVIRGEDHISNTPKQVVIYQALGFKVPKFAHLPLIVDEERARLSKRAGAVAVTDYRKEGFLPEAIVNYLMLLGWSPGNNQEIVSLQNAVKNFSIKKINKAAAAFSMEKLQWINTQYIKQAETPKLIELLKPFLKERGFDYAKLSDEQFKNIVNLYKGRLSTLLDFCEWVDYVFVDQVKISDEDKQKYLTPDKVKYFKPLSQNLSALSEYTVQTTEKVFRDLLTELSVESSELVHPVRVALTGKTVGPGLFDTMVILGKDKTIQRLTSASSQ